MGQKTSKAENKSQGGLVEELIDETLLKNEIIFEDHISICPCPLFASSLLVSISYDAYFFV
jgi:hypothetical protein